MTAANYDASLARLLVHEGGYSNHPSDPGGPTNYGITIHDYRKYIDRNGTAADVRAMTVEQAKLIYRRRYWDVQRCDQLPAGVDYAIFDYGVNSGIGRSGKVLRRVLGLSDGTSAISDEVIATAGRRDPKVLASAICDERLAFLRGLATWPTFGRGWGRRVAEVRAAALAMAGASQGITQSPQTGRADSAADLAARIVRAMQARNYRVDSGAGELNIVYVEGLNPDGTQNDNRNNVFNDLRVVVRVSGGIPVILGKWEATTEPSRKWTLSPMNPGGAFHIKFGQYKAWAVGTHHTHEALVQVGTIEGYRDPDKTFKRDLKHPVSGAEFGVNQHWGYDLLHDDMGNSSAGCLVGRSTAGHREFMKLIKSDSRYVANRNYRFTTTILPAAALFEFAVATPVPGKGEVPAPKPTGPIVVAGGAGSTAAVTWWQWVAAHPWQSGALAAGAVLMTIAALYALKRWRQAKQEAPTPGLVPVPAPSDAAAGAPVAIRGGAR